MADRLPINFDIPQESAVASYNWTELASGLGYVTFYGAMSATGGTSPTVVYNLLSNPLPSNPHLRTLDGIYALQHSATAYTVDTNVFNTPRLLQGTAYVSATLGIENNTASITMTVKLQHVRGAVVTDISSSLTSMTFTTSSDTTLRRNVIIPLDLTTTNIKKGDIIRLLVTNTGSAGGARTTRIGFCPVSTDANYQPFKLSLPFKIEI
jgi:hypothetical protein